MPRPRIGLVWGIRAAMDTLQPYRCNAGMGNAVLLLLALVLAGTLVTGTWLDVRAVQESVRPVSDLASGVRT
jgi:hypothetical protein